MPVVQLTPSLINNITVQPGKARTEWCDKNQPGLYVEARATAPGKGTYYLRYKDAGGTTRHMRLGNTDSLSLSEARSLAKDQRAKIQLGADPSGDIQRQKELPTLREFVEEQYLPYIKPRKRSARDDENRLRQRILPAFGDRRMNSITRKQLIDFHLSLKDDGLAGATCDHFVKLIRRIYNLAIEWDVLKDNPAAKAQLFNEPNQVNNILTDEELRRLLIVLQTHPRRTVCQIVLLLLSTGARKGEALNAGWRDIDFARGTWTIPARVSKSKTAHTVYLNETALEVIYEIQPDSALRQGFLFVNPKTRDRLKTIDKAWCSIREEARLPKFRVHDLRHMFASFLVNSGRTLYEVSQALHHSDVSISARYSHLSSGTLRDASAAASTIIQAASPKPTPPELKLIKTGS